MVHKFPYIYSVNQEALKEVVTHYWTPSEPLCHLAGFLVQSRPQKSKQDVKHANLNCHTRAGNHCGIFLLIVSPLPQDAIAERWHVHDAVCSSRGGSLLKPDFPASIT